jgi:hypothetical protein
MMGSTSIRHSHEPGNMYMSLAYFLRLGLVPGLTFGLAAVNVNFSAAEQKNNVRLEEFAKNGFHQEIPGLYEGTVALDSVLERFGKPLKTTTKKVPSSEPKVDSEILVLEYSGLAITLWRPDVALSSYVVSEIKLTSSQYPLKYGLRTGLSRPAFLKQLGPPNAPIEHYKEGALAYLVEISQGAGKYGNFVLIEIDFDQKDRAREITWAQIVD